MHAFFVECLVGDVDVAVAALQKGYDEVRQLLSAAGVLDFHDVVVAYGALFEPVAADVLRKLDALCRCVTHVVGFGRWLYSL